ncbi:MAG: TraR/DksA C4-type zinc finger protein [Gallionella sp.]
MRPEDIAQELELEAWEQRQKDAILTEPNQPSATHCEDCEVRIPTARREYVLGVTRCVECQAFYEKFRRCL